MKPLLNPHQKQKDEDDGGGGCVTRTWEDGHGRRA